MRKYLIGFFAGIVMGATIPAAAATIVGNMGYLSGWSVTKDGEEICYMPFVWPSIREIECD